MMAKTTDPPLSNYDDMPFGVFRITPAGVIVFINTTIVDMLGYESKSELLTVNVNDLFSNARDRNKFLVLLKKNGSFSNFETCLFKKDKICLWVSISATTASDKKGNVIYFDGIVEDITRKKQIEIELIQEKLFSETVINSLPAIFYMFDEHGRYVRTNDQHSQATGYSLEETLQMTTLDFFPPRLRPYISTKIETIFRNGRAEAEACLQTKDGREVPYYFSGSLVKIDGRRYGVGVGMDMTEKYQQEKLLRQAQKMEAIGALASGIAHDFNNILSTIFGFTQLAIDGLSTDSKERRRLEKVLESAQRAKSLVSQIRLFSRPSEKKKEAIQLSPIIEETIKFMRATLPATIEIRADLTAINDRTMADPTQIHQILMNLCTNARHAMQDNGGILEISLADTVFEVQTSIEQKRLPPGAYLALTVRDTGCGIPREHMERIFDPYFTTKEKGDGTGLGLAIVFGIVKDMGGAIRVSSQVGTGTTVRLYFPLLPQVKDRPETTNVPSSAAIKGRVMIVDDETDLLQAYGEMLENMGCHVTTHDESHLALEDFANHPEHYDLVLTDFTMPGMTGVQLAEAVHCIRSKLPVVMFSGSIADISEDEIQRAGIAEIIGKPLDKDELFTVLAHYLTKGT